MAGRVTDTMMYGKGEQSMTRAREKMIKNQEIAVTGKSVNRPSDNPVAAMQLIGLKAKEERDLQVGSNLEMANNVLSMTDSSLGELTELMSRAKELAIQMSSTSNFNDDSRLATSHEIEQLMYRAIQIGNARVGDRYIFGGYQTDRPPIDIDGNYFGDAGVFEMELDQGQKMAINVTALETFYGKKTLSPEAQKVRDDLKLNSTPTIEGALRAPASSQAASNNPKDPAEGKVGGPQVEKSLAESSGGGLNIFLAFKNLSDGLKDGNIRMVQSSVDDFDEGFKQVLSVRALVGSRQNLVTSSMNGIERSKVSNAEMVSQAQDADTYKVFSDLAKNEHTLNAALETNKRLLSPSLLDFLK